MSVEESYAFAGHSLIGTLATIGPRGFPHQVNMMHAFTDNTLEFTAFRKSQKVVNLLRDPRASFLIEKTMPYSEIKGALFVGEIEVLDDYNEVVRIANNVAQRFQQLHPEDWDRNPQVDIELTAQKRMALKLNLRKITSWDHSKLGGGY
ncbi:pyridoxamine 5'-phosphate oxidase family protein [Microbacterium sp. A93]|uniref:pyridoxamine 5'-phosphate oxidase family protein n=1 Tax=Microbacterium sp. A93 TaxID=3450716 RepID=UPI003F43DC37